MPLLLKLEGGEGNDAYVLPIDDKGTLKFSSKETIELNCPGGHITLSDDTTDSVSSPATCVSGKKFKVGKKPISFDEITCSKYPKHVARYTGKSCLSTYKEIEIGFPLDDGRFLKHIEICFDDNLQTTLYSKFNLTHAVGGNQINFPRPSFIEDKFYSLGKHKLNNLYTRYVQRIHINGLLGLPKEDYTYVDKTNDYYLARGHLTAKADMVYGSQQRFTFYFVNVAPQWQTLNAGNWVILEENVRDYAFSNKLDLIVYTGTHGITTLPHSETGEDTELFLYVDGSRKGVPVPRLFWKIAYEPNTKAGIAFISINNPYTKNVSKDIICEDICDKITWLTWKQKDIKSGYSYCCSVEEFRKAISTVPEFTVEKLLT